MIRPAGRQGPGSVPERGRNAAAFVCAFSTLLVQLLDPDGILQFC